MLRYLAQGLRRFGQSPMAPVGRINWEFFAVLKGRCAPLFNAQPALPLHQATLWVFPPDNVHGWTGAHASCRVAVFHFGSVPALLEQRARRAGYLVAELDADKLRRVRELSAELEPHFRRPTNLSPLHEQRVLMELSLLALENSPAAPLANMSALAHDKVEAAIAAYRRRLSSRATVQEVAAEIHVSPSHLRRLFWEVREESPRSAFAALTMERAKELLSETTMTLTEVAAECGFGGASEFCRAFRRRFKLPPAVWRGGLLPRYKPPVRTAGGRSLYPQDQHATVLKLRKYLARG